MRAVLLPLGVAILAFWGEPAYSDPVFTTREQDRAEDRAKEENLPIAWVCSTSEIIADKDPRKTWTGSSHDLTKMAMSTLHEGDDSCVVVFINGGEELRQCPHLVFSEVTTQDPDSGQFRYYYPKIVFTNPDASVFLGKVTCGQLEKERDSALLNMILHASRVMERGVTPSDQPPASTPQSTSSGSSNDTASDPSIGPLSIIPKSDLLPNLNAGSTSLIAIVVLAVTCGCGLLVYQIVQWVRPHDEPPYRHPSQKPPDYPQ